MTVEELARAMGKDIGEILLCCLRSNETKQLKSVMPLSRVAKGKMSMMALVIANPSLSKVNCTHTKGNVGRHDGRLKRQKIRPSELPGKTL